MPDSAPQQLLHLVNRRRTHRSRTPTFKDLDQVEIVGVFPNYATAYAAWKAKAQQTVDNAQWRYFRRASPPAARSRSRHESAH